MTTQTAGRGSELTAIDWNVLDALKVLQKPGKPDVRGKLIDSYLSSSPSLFERAKTAVTEADGPSLMSAAHSIKSSSIAIGAISFGKTCFELEQLGRSNNLDNSAAILERAEREFDSVCAALLSVLEQMR